MSRRFPLRPAPASGPRDWAMELTMPPIQPAAAPDDGGTGGGECGTPEMFVASAVSPFLGDGRLITLSVHRLRPEDEVMWTVTSSESFNYILSADGVTSTDHIALLAYFGGVMTGTCTVNGESAGSFDFTEGASIPEPYIDPTDPTP